MYMIIVEKFPVEESYLASDVARDNSFDYMVE